jgi:integrase
LGARSTQRIGPGAGRGSCARRSFLMVTIASASNFSKSMSNAAAREWPKRRTTVTPYCFRHQAAADMKADGQLGSGEISAALGHLSDATKSTYGHANMCKGRGVAPTRVTAARPVKMRAVAKIKPVKVKK